MSTRTTPPRRCPASSPRAAKAGVSANERRPTWFIPLGRGASMRAQQIRKFVMLRRVQQFLDEFAAKMAAVNATAARQEFDQLVAEKGVNQSEQATTTPTAKSQTPPPAALR